MALFNEDIDICEKSIAFVKENASQKETFKDKMGDFFKSFAPRGVRVFE